VRVRSCRCVHACMRVSVLVSVFLCVKHWDLGHGPHSGFGRGYDVGITGCSFVASLRGGRPTLLPSHFKIAPRHRYFFITKPKVHHSTGKAHIADITWSHQPQNQGQRASASKPHAMPTTATKQANEKLSGQQMPPQLPQLKQLKQQQNHL